MQCVILTSPLMHLHALSRIYGQLPDYLTTFRSLQSLNMHFPVLATLSGFAGLTGTIPPALFNLQSITYLDFGVNAFSGSIPEDIK